jgi:hypothetical protein
MTRKKFSMSGKLMGMEPKNPFQWIIFLFKKNIKFTDFSIVINEMIEKKN